MTLVLDDALNSAIFLESLACIVPAHLAGLNDLSKRKWAQEMCVASLG